MGAYCNQSSKAEALYDILTKMLGERGPAWAMTGPIKWEVANCLDMCGAGPNLLIYPGGECYNHLDVATLEAIVQELLKGQA
jgi:(2Fe-2S) ferredoxin